MSTNPGTSRSPSPSSELTARRPRLPAAALRALVPFAAVLLMILGAAIAPPLARLWSQLTERSDARASLGSLIETARRQPVDYDALRADPAAFKDRPVLWCVDHPASGVSYLAGKPSRPLAWSNDSELPLNSPTGGGRCTELVAVLEGARAGVPLLRFVGRP